MSDETCPFHVGETVVYRPTERGRGLVVMTDFAALNPGAEYKVVKVVQGRYIVPEGFENAAGGGVYWTEFAPCK